MSIEIKISKKPVEYTKAINFLEKRLDKFKNNIATELVWILEHPKIYTGGTSYKNYEILDKNIKIINTNRGGKITWHGPGQLVCYFVIDISKRKKDIRKFISAIENSIIETLKDLKIISFSDRNNIGIWDIDKKEKKKIAAIGFRVKK